MRYEEAARINELSDRLTEIEVELDELDEKIENSLRNMEKVNGYKQDIAILKMEEAIVLAEFNKLTD